MFSPFTLGSFSMCDLGFFAFEHFLVALEPVAVSVSAAVALSFFAPAQEFVNKFVSQVVSNL